MFSESAEYYDLVYRSKDYRGEAEKLQELLSRYVPHARTILDVGCGTGEHLRFFPQYQRVGLDIQADFVRLAKAKLPEADFHLGDMRQFQLGTKFDVILCLFGSIGYLLDDESIRSALTSFRNHLDPRGAILLEPWIEPDAWTDRPAHLTTVDDGERKVCRVMSNRRDRDRTLLEAHYLFVRGSTVRYANELHELRLINRTQWLSFVREAGFCVNYLPGGLTSRGLYVLRIYRT